MKTFNKLFSLAAIAIFGLSACEQEKLSVNSSIATHTVTFIAETSETKTVAGIENGTVKYSFTESDLDRINIYENGEKGTIVKENSSVTEGIMSLTATFAGNQTEAEKVYTAVLNGGSISTQVMYSEAYDEDADILVAEPVSTVAATDIKFCFKREVAIAKMTLKGLGANEIPEIVTITSDKDLAGAFDGKDWTFPTTAIELTSSAAMEVGDYEITANEAGEAVIWFTCIPQEDSNMSVSVTTKDGKNYSKTFSRPLSLTRNNITAFSVALQENTELPTDKELVFDFKTSTPDGWPTDYATTGADYVYTLNSVDYTFNVDINTKVGSSTGSNPKYYLLIKKNGKLGLPAIEGYRLAKVVGVLNDNGSPSTKSEISIQDTANSVVKGGDAQTWTEKGGAYTYTLPETEANTVYYLSVSNAANTQIITLTLTYEPASTTPRYNVTLTQVEGGALAASATRAEEGTVIELTATADDGYLFNNDWKVLAGETEITVTDGKFTLPAQNVIVSATFNKIEYAITATQAEHGTYTVKIGDAAVTKATVGDKITLAATAEEGYVFNGWTVKDANNADVYVSNNSFTMPASNVTISAIFGEKPVSEYEHEGTAEDPYSVEDVLKFIGTLDSGVASGNDVYVKGVISSIKEVSTQYGNATYNIKAEGSDAEVTIYRGLYLDGAKFTAANQIEVGDIVVVCGKALNYSGTPELNSGNSLVSIEKAPYLKASANKTSVAAAGETITITVDTNVEGTWTASSSDNTNFAIDTKTATTVDIVVSENTAETERTATITITAGSLQKTVELKQVAAGGTVTYESYSTGFESNEGFTAGTNYQSTITAGAEGKQWKIFYGTPSTSSFISGSQSLALRLYTSNNYGYGEMQFDVPGATNVAFKAKAAKSNSADIKLTIKESTDGGITWTTVEGWNAKSLTSTATDYSFAVTGNPEKYRIRFEIDPTSTKPTSKNAQLTIDDVVISVD